MARTLVAYFSATGTTARLADRISDAAGADAFEISPETPYTAADLDWHNSKSRSSVEMKDESARPPIKSRVRDFEGYDTILLGFPIWWYQAPRIIETFLESYDFTGKKVACFATSGSSGIGDTVAILQKVCPDATWLSGAVLNRPSDTALQEWLDHVIS